MTALEIIAAVLALDDLAELAKCGNAVKERREAIWQANQDRALAETWERMRRWKPGITLWCCSTGVFLGGDLQRGGKVTVERIYHGRSPGRRMAFLKVPGKRASWWSVAEVMRYDLRTVAPVVTDENRQHIEAANRIGRAFAEAR